MGAVSRLDMELCTVLPLKKKSEDAGDAPPRATGTRSKDFGEGNHGARLSPTGSERPPGV